MQSQINKLKNDIGLIYKNIFTAFTEWVNGEYELNEIDQSNHFIDYKYDILDKQPINSAFTIGNQILHRVFTVIPDNISYEVVLKNKFVAGIDACGDFDLYITLIDGDLIEKKTETHLRKNIVYIIPAGQHFNLATETFAIYKMILVKANKFIEVKNPQTIKKVDEEVGSLV